MHQYLDILIFLFLIILSRIFSDLTIGYSSLNKSDLIRKSRLGNIFATKILLLGNVATNTALAIFFSSNLFGSYLARPIVTAVNFIFGELLPQSIFQKHSLKLGFIFYPLMRLIILIFYPIKKTISTALYLMLGKEKDLIYSKKELAELIKDHENSKESSIDKDEEKILLGALSFSEKKAMEAMTLSNKVIIVDVHQEIDNKFILKLKNSGHTRFPVFDGDD